MAVRLDSARAPCYLRRHRLPGAPEHVWAAGRDVDRSALLEEIVIDGPPALLEVVASFEDGLALWDAIVARGLEGVVAKREREPYRPGQRTWVKTKNRATVRFQEELASAQRRRSAH